MIEKVNLLPPGFDGIPRLRIEALFNTYGDNTELYVQKADGQLTAFFGGAGGGFSLCATLDADFSELDSFFSLLGTEVFCERYVAEKLSLGTKKHCNIMRLRNNLSGNISHSKISEVYGSLQKGTDGDIELPPFDLWYTDFCIRFNHNSAEYALLTNAVAVCGFMTEKASLITGVAVDPAKRKNGYGKQAVADLVTAIKEKYKLSEIYAASSDQNKGFYENLGFVLDSECAVLRYGSV